MSGYVIPEELMERIDRVLKFYATYGSWHYSDLEMRAPPRACSAMDRRPMAIIDEGKAAGEVYADLVKLYPLPKSAPTPVWDGTLRVHGDTVINGILIKDGTVLHFQTQSLPQDGKA